MKTFTTHSSILSFFAFLSTLLLCLFCTFTLQAQVGSLDPGFGGSDPYYITGPANVQTGQAVTYQISGNLFASVQWSVPAGAVSVQNLNGSLQITWNSPGTYTLTAVVYEYFGGFYNVSLSPITVTQNCPLTPNLVNTSVSGFAGCSIPIQIQSPPANTTYRWYDAPLRGNRLDHSIPLLISGTSPNFSYTNPIAGTYTIYVAAFSNDCESVRRAVTVTVSSFPSNAPSVQAPAAIFVGQTLTLSVNNPVAGLIYRWFNENNEPLATGTSYQPPVTGAGTFIRCKVRASACGSILTSDFSPLTDIPVYAPPSISSNLEVQAGVHLLAPGQGAVLALNESYSGVSYLWEKQVGTAWASAGSSSETLPLPIGETGTYRLRVSLNGQSVLSNTITVKKGVASQNLNYIVENTVLAEGVGTVSQVEALTISKDGRMQSITYFDGLGRPIQQVATKASPTGRDIVQPIVYDAFGRTPKAYLPYTQGSSGAYRPDAIKSIYEQSEQYFFYNQDNRAAGSADYWKAGHEHSLPQTLTPYAETVFEASPLNRPLEQGAAGKSWQISAGHTIKTRTLVNEASEGIRIWNIGYGANEQPGTTATYGSGELLVEEIIDEHGFKTKQYTDKRGQVILKSVQEDYQFYIHTYYVYDDFGLLRYVFPPEAVKKMQANGWNVNSTGIAELVFYYRYDARKRMIVKKVPGAGEVHMVYDKLDRLILSQDATQRQAGEWLFTKYDVFARPIMTGIYQSSDSQSALQAQANAHTGLLYESRSASPTYQYYTATQAYPALNAQSILHSVTYYDDHNFDNAGGPDKSYNSDVASQGNTAASSFDRLKGQVTGTKVRILTPPSGDGGLWISTTTFYDNRYRVIQTQSDNHLGGKDFASMQYDFAGRVLYSHIYHSLDTEWDGTGIRPSTRAISLKQRSDFDHGGRVLKVYEQVNGQAEVLHAEMRYNELGELVEKKLGEKSANSFLQNVHFQYNIRGWLSKINDTQLSEGALFGMELLYDQNFRPARSIGKANYNGNITGILWKSALCASSPIRSYAYEYDALNRLKEADYKASADGFLWDKEVGYFNESITGYDANGNILGIERRGLRNLNKLAQPEPSDFGLIDQLSYTYSSQNPNQLLRVHDAITASIGNGIDFKDGADSPQEYTYDANGNLSADANKNIESIAYNHLNLPTKILFTGNREISFLYDAAGVKLRKTVRAPNAGEQVTDYLGGFVYENEELAFFPHAEGRWLPIEGAFAPEYQYKDHLGNLRLSFRGQVAEVFKATMEEDAQTNGQPEEVVFDFIEQTRDNTQHNEGASSAKLSPEQPIGMWKSLPLRRGDKVKAEVYGKYVSAPTNNSVNIFPFINPLPATMPAGEGNNNPAWLSAGLAISPVSHNNTGIPKSYLRGQFFDTQGNFLRAVSVSLSEGNAWQELSFDFEAEIEGTLQVFVGSESDVSVWYDDMQITWEHALIVQENHYYPFGMNLVGIEKRGNPEDKFQYNGKEKQEEFGLNAYDYGARLYSFDAPRWWQVDPKAEEMRRWSPYNYVFNNPLRYTDPDGMKPDDEYYSRTGKYLGRDNKTTDNIRIIDESAWNVIQQTHQPSSFGASLTSTAKDKSLTKNSVGIRDAKLSAEAVSNVYTHILDQMPDVDISKLHNGRVSVNIGTGKIIDGKGWVSQGVNDPSGMGQGVAVTDKRAGSEDWLPEGKGYTEEGTGNIKITISVNVAVELSTLSGAQNILGAHEFQGHGEKGYAFEDKSRYDPKGNHYKAYDLQKNHPSWQRTDSTFKKGIEDTFQKYKHQTGQ